MNDKIILETRDLTHLVWAKYRRSSGTAGSFLKAYDELNGKKVYYKLSAFDREFIFFGLGKCDTCLSARCHMEYDHNEVESL